MCSKSAPRMTTLGGNGRAVLPPETPFRTGWSLSSIWDAFWILLGWISVSQVFIFELFQTYLASKDPSDLCTRRTLERIK